VNRLGWGFHYRASHGCTARRVNRATNDQEFELGGRGPIPARDGFGSNCSSAPLLKRMLKAGVSRYHPDPLPALAKAKQARWRKIVNLWTQRRNSKRRHRGSCNPFSQISATLALTGGYCFKLRHWDKPAC
jgi:hypothetical protein